MKISGTYRRTLYKVCKLCTKSQEVKPPASFAVTSNFLLTLAIVALSGMFTAASTYRSKGIVSGSVGGNGGVVIAMGGVVIATGSVKTGSGSGSSTIAPSSVTTGSMGTGVTSGGGDAQRTISGVLQDIQNVFLPYNLSPMNLPLISVSTTKTSSIAQMSRQIFIVIVC